MNFRILFLFTLIFNVLGCNAPKNKYNHEIIPGLATPIAMQPDSTIVDLGDYFPDLSPLLEFTSEKLQIDWNKTTNTLVIKEKSKATFYVLTCKTTEGDYHIPVFPPKQIAVSLRIESDSDYVAFVGEATNWQPIPAKKIDNEWVFDTLLLPGTYQYQWVMGNTWFLDPNNPDTVDNNVGGYNSLLTVSESNEPKPLLSFDNVEGANFSFECDKKLDEAYVFWENRLIKSNLINNKVNALVPSDAKQSDKSYIRVWAVSGGKLTADAKLPITKGNVITDASQLQRSFFESQVLYFMMVDRFFNGDSTNDYKVTNPPIHPKANYYGGDIAGILAKMKEGYFDKLNINTIWLSPITQNAVGAFREFPEPKDLYSGYHGYWPTLSTKVDFRFGNDTILQALVDEAHSRNMNIILDYVANHFHKDHHLIQKNPHWATTLDLPDGRKNIRIWDEHRLTTWFDDFLPSLDYSNPEVVELMSDSALYWIQKFGLDGFRHDATKHIPDVFWKTLTSKLKKNITLKEKRALYQIGETFGSRQLIGSYVSSGQLDGQFDFNLYFDAVSVFAKDEEPTNKLANSLLESLDYYGYNHLMGNITGNHDLPRFIAYAGEGLSWSEDPKKAGYSRDVKIENKVGYLKLRSLLGFLFSIPGVPVVYYGDEIGMVGAGDPDNRRPMQFDNLNNDELLVKNLTEKLTAARRTKMPLLYGSTQVNAPNPKQLTITRLYNREAAISVFNKSDDATEMLINVPENLKNKNFKDLNGKTYEAQNGQIQLIIEPNNFILLLQ